MFVAESVSVSGPLNVAPTALIVTLATLIAPPLRVKPPNGLPGKPNVAPASTVIVLLPASKSSVQVPTQPGPAVTDAVGWKSIFWVVALLTMTTLPASVTLRSIFMLPTKVLSKVKVPAKARNAFVKSTSSENSAPPSSEVATPAFEFSTCAWKKSPTVSLPSISRLPESRWSSTLDAVTFPSKTKDPPTEPDGASVGLGLFPSSTPQQPN